MKKLWLTVAGALVVAAPPAFAANWLMLQGAEAPSAAPAAKVWGFLQPTYARTGGEKLAAGPWAGQNAVFNVIAPDLQTSDTFYVARARIGVRGQNFPLNSKINYFLMAEFANNGLTASNGGAAMLADASVTLNYIPGARIRVGQFKYPGAEEGLQAYPITSPYVNFTNATDQLLLERFFDGDGADTPATGAAGSGNANLPNGAIGAFRDVGVQVFDSFTTGAWETSYAVMVGNGNGVGRGDNDNNREVYAYLSTEWLLGGEGPYRNGLKLFLWNEDGKRLLRTGATQTLGEFDRTRSGAGIAFRKRPFRATVEYIRAAGMINDGTDGGAVAGATSNNGAGVASFNMAPIGEADGYYVDLGYRFLRNFEANLRYDVLNRRTDSRIAEREFAATTVGMQYFFDRKNRVIVNYEMRAAAAPNLPSGSPANVILDGTSDRVTIQLSSIF